MRLPHVVVVTPVFNSIALTERYLKSFKKVTYKNHRIVIVNDGSTDETATVLAEKYPHVTVLTGDGNLWWAGGTNMGVEFALGEGADYVLTINNDVEVKPDFLSRLIKTARSNPRSIVGSRIHFMDDPERVWGMGGYLYEKGISFFHAHYGDTPLKDINLKDLPQPFPVQTICGNGTLIPVEIFHRIGLYDAQHFPQYHADAELCLRAQQHQYRCFIDTGAVIFNDFGNTGKPKSAYDLVFGRRSHLAIFTQFRAIKYFKAGAMKKFSIYLRTAAQYLILVLRYYELWPQLKDDKKLKVNAQ